MIRSLVRYTRVISIVEDILTVRAKDAKFGELALVEHRSGEESLAQVIRLCGDAVSLQVFSGGRGISTGVKVRLLGHPMRVPVSEVAYVCVGDARLKSEIPRVEGRQADLQVFEETDGVAVGDRVELTGRMLSATLGPGLLGTIYDGLQNPPENLAAKDGYFLKRGYEMDPLDPAVKWQFSPVCRIGARLRAGDCLGTVPERAIRHKIMVPFNEPGELEVIWIASGDYRFEDEEQARDYFTRLTNLLENLYYSEYGEEQYRSFLAQIEKTFDEYR